MNLPWSKSPEERMLLEIEAELQSHVERCKVLHENFEQQLRRRDEALATLAEADGRIKELQREGVSLLGSLNRAMVSGDEDRLRRLEGSQKENSRELVRARKSRENAARQLDEVELDEVEAARGLKQDVLDVLHGYAALVEQRRERLDMLLGTLKDKQGELAQTAAPIIAEYESRRGEEGEEGWEDQGD